MRDVFHQAPPELGNQYDEDRVLDAHLRRILPGDVLRAVEPELREMGDLAGGRLYRMQLEDRANEPVLTQWNPWGERIDAIELTPLWREAERIAAEKGLVATAYERRHGRFSRTVQFALAYLFGPSSDVYTCPLAMTDGAASTLLRSGNASLTERAVPRLTSRDPERFWTSGQWMTESTGGSDVGRSETVARRDENGQWRLWGRKWFTSAATSQMALTLARPEGNGPGGRGLALFYLEPRDERGRLRNIEVNRLKDKLGTRKVPTAELELLGAPAEPVVGLTDGVRAIAPMLNVTRTWNAVLSVAPMRRGLALARDFARKRVAFGAPLAVKPLHADTLAGLQAEFEAGFQVAFRVIELIGAEEAGELDEAGVRLLRMLTPIQKLLTARQAVAVTSEILEAFGGAGYVEDTGLPVLLRDAQVLPIWEGTTNVLSLDTLRALGSEGGADLLRQEVDRTVAGVADPVLARLATAARETIAAAEAWLRSVAPEGDRVEAGARRFALTVGRALALGLLVRQAQWSLDHDGDARPRAAAVRFAHHGISLLVAVDPGESAALANDELLHVANEREVG